MRVRINVVHNGTNYAGEVELLPAEDPEQDSTSLGIELRARRPLVTRPSGAVHLLYSRRFFEEPHKLPEVWRELRKQGYNFSRPSILMALKAATYLTMGGKRGAYSFVQKFPPAGG